MRRMRGRATKSLIALGVALAGLALALLGTAPAFRDGVLSEVFPAVGVAVTFAAVFFSLPMEFNVPGLRLVTYAALLCNVVVVYVGSGSLLLAAVPLPLAFWLPPTEFMASRPALLKWAHVICIGSSAILFLLAWPTGYWGFAAAPWLLSLMVAMRWVQYPKTLRAFDERPKPLKVGSPMPPLRLPRRDGGPAFDLSEQTGFTLLCFLRGDWCPICHVMMRLFRKEASTLARYNVNLVAISPTQGEAAQAFARDMALHYTYLVDEHAQLAKQWGILDLGEFNGDPVPMPVCMLVDPGGVLRFLSRPEDFSTFADKSKVLALVEAHAAKAA
jgi:peroxiredoxin